MTSFLARTVCLGALMLALVGLAPVAAAKTIVVIAPHPDDEALIAAGTVRNAILAGHTVKIVVVTNGDFQGTQTGLQRQVESVNSAGVLGLAEQHVIFLGYPDGGLGQIYNAPNPNTVITSNAGQTQTYGNRGWNNTDYHRGRFGSPGAYNRVTLEQDLRTLLGELQPDEVYTVSHFDSHGDHAITAILVAEALAALKRSGALPATKLNQGIVWAPGQESLWPSAEGAGGCSPDTPFPAPQMQTPHEWKRTLRATVLANLKCQAIGAFSSQATPHLLSFARKNEFFWASDFGKNLALTATVTASSESVSQGRMRAVDGIVDGAFHDETREWVSANQGTGAWIQLDWPAPVSVSQVNLHDRPLSDQNVLAGTLSFSDGSSIAVGALPPDGKLLPVTFAPKSVSWVRFTITQANGMQSGLSEIQVLGVPLAQAGTNVAPHFIEGPGGSSDLTILSSQTASLSVQAHDLNGDALQYQWSADGGTIQGNGTSAVFTPPSVSGSTVFTITAQILDGRGGSASSVAFVTVTAAADAVALSPTVVTGGNSAQGTVTLASPASGGGLSVPLSSSQPSVASVPSSVTVPSGSASATFPVNTAAVGSRVDVTITANIHGTPRTAVIAVTPPASPVPPGNLLLSPDQIGDGNWLHFGAITPTLNFAAAPDGTQNASRAETTGPGGHALAQAVNVAASTAYTFSFQARNNGGTAAAYSVHCESLGTDIVPATSYIGSINGSSWTPVSTSFTTPAGCTRIVVYPVRDSGTPVDVLLWRALLVPGSVPPPVTLASLAVSPSSVTGGGSATGTATLSAAAPAGGAQVSLSSNNSAVTVPASVTVTAGATSATFNVTTSTVATTTSATITGSHGGETRTASLTVTPAAAALSSLSASPSSVTGGTSSTGTVTLTAAAPAGGAVVTLSDDSSATSVPASVTVAAGATSATFSIGTITVAAATTSTITATYSGATRTASLTVLPPPLPSVASLSVNPASVTGGTGSTGTVTLSGAAPAGGVQVALSDDSGATSVPASVTVAAGATSANFSIGTSAVAASTTSTISATFGGQTRTDTLVVLPAALVSLTLNPTSVVGAPLLGNSTGTVTLSGPAPAGGAVVTLTDNSAACNRPSSVTIPAGATSASFTVTTTIVLITTTCTVTGTYQGTNRSANLQILL